jgi:hypothetical protein
MKLLFKKRVVCIKLDIYIFNAIVTWSISGHLVHIRPLGPYQATWPISGHLVHIRSLGPYQVTWSISGHLVHIRSLGPYQATGTVPVCIIQSVFNVSALSRLIR